MAVEGAARARRTQEERRSEAEEALLDAAMELVAERGIVQTSLAQIGDRAGYSRGLATHHFGSKDTLIDRLACRCQERFFDSVARIDAPTGLDGIVAFLDRYLEIFARGPTEARAMLVLWGASFPNESPVAGIADADRRARDGLATWIQKGRRDGSIRRSADPEALGVALLGLLRGIAAQLVVDPGSVDAKKVRSQCRRLVVAALRPDA